MMSSSGNRVRVNQRDIETGVLEFKTGGKANNSATDDDRAARQEIPP